MTDGPIMPDSKLGEKLGFTNDLFDGYLFIRGNEIYISAIISRKKGQGNLSKLFNKIEEEGYKIAVPGPMDHMKMILLKKGFLPTMENCHPKHGIDKIDVWRKQYA